MYQFYVFYCCRPLDCRTAKTGGTVNGGAYAPFVLPLTGLAGFATRLDMVIFALLMHYDITDYSNSNVNNPK